MRPPTRTVRVTSSTRRVVEAWAVAVLFLGAACHRSAPPSAPESGVKSVVARIDGITCATCVPPLTASLQQTYAKSTVEVDDDKDVARVKFAGGDDFSPEAFRAAVQRVRMRVVTVSAQACGTIEAKDGQQWLVAGKNRFVVESDQTTPVGQPLCVDGTIDTGSGPAVFRVSSFSLQGASSGS